METDDFKEGYEAFKQKREPHWPSMPPSFYDVRRSSNGGDNGQS
jgi:hypothetical protein